MRVRLQAQCLQKCSINSLSVWVFRTGCSQLSISRCDYLCASIFCPQHCMGIYTHIQQVFSKDSIDGPKDHLSDTMLSKDKQGPRKIIFRGLIIRSISFEHLEGSTLSFEVILRFRQAYQTYSNCWPCQSGGWLTWSTYRLPRTSFTSWPNTDKVQTQVHQQTPPWL